MIQITDKDKCSGCTACIPNCPKQCISMKSDEEGFAYAIVDLADCIDCGICERICPVLNQEKPRIPKQVYAAYSKDEETRLSSSSGGLFAMLARRVIDDGGVVFGARFDERFNVVHDYTESIDGIKAFQGSKYVQSRMLGNYAKVKKFLKEGRKVLFSGLPCQIAGLNHYLHKRYSNLLTVECVCHGVPSPMVWEKYLSETCTDPMQIYFRGKKHSWKNYDVVIMNKDGNELRSRYHDNHYMQVFLSDLSLRPSCYKCPSKNGKSMCDITLGDFWGIDTLAPEFDDDKGCGLLMVHTMEGERAVGELDIVNKSHDYDDARRCNTAIYKSADRPVYRRLFMWSCRKYGFNRSYNLIMSPAMSCRLLRRLISIFFR